MPDNLDQISLGQPFEGVQTFNTGNLDSISLGQPEEFIISGTLSLTPDPIVIPILLPTPSVVFSTNLTPDPILIPLVLPDPQIVQARTFNPDPIVIVLALPDPVLAVYQMQPYRDIQRRINVDDWTATLTFYLEIHAFTSDAGNPII